VRQESEKGKSSVDVSVPEFSYAAQMSLRSAGKEDAGQLFKEAMATPTRAPKMRSAWKVNQENVDITSFTTDEALSFFVNNKHQHQVIRSSAKQKNADIYPSYNNIREAKQLCYRSKESFTVIDTLAEVKLQDLLNHTILRIVQAHEILLSRVAGKIIQKLALVSKWVFDGTTGHSEYKQRFPREYSDSYLFLTSLVPIQLFTSSSTEEKIVLWQNPRPLSTRYCRPIRLQFRKEPNELIREEKEHIEKKIKLSLPTRVVVTGQEFFVFHEMLFTMIDGKVCNAITSTSSAQVCYICRASPKEMNTVDGTVRRPVDITALRFDLSTLHA
jgi:hypothetical protein